MSKLIVTQFITLDGVTEAPGGETTHPHTGWVGEYFSPDIEQWKLAETAETEALLLGRVTYESFSQAWPKRGGAFADRFNALPKHVVSSTLEGPLSWNARLITGDVVEAIRRLKASAEGPIAVHGSATLVRFLLDNDLVDELRLMVFPVIIGGGKRPFADDRKKHALKLVDTKTFRKGVVAHTFARA